jgi:hypothetical protein
MYVVALFDPVRCLLASTYAPYRVEKLYIRMGPQIHFVHDS